MTTDKQKFVDEVRDLCRRHGIVMIGSCEDEGIFGEISLYTRAEMAERDYIDFPKYLSNSVEKDRDGCDVVVGIGDCS